jgi:hypothetical protein
MGAVDANCPITERGREPAVNSRRRQCGMAYYPDYLDSEPLAAEPAKWSMRRTLAFLVVTSLGLWSGFFWATAKLVALI